MPADIPLILFSLLLGLFGVVGLVEHSLYGGFNRTYYTHGVPFVILRIPAAASFQALPAPDLLKDQFRSSLIGSLVFQQIAPDTYGFRRRFFQSAWFPNNLMHGMLQFDRAGGGVVVKGFFNTLMLLLVLAILVFSVLSPFLGWFRLLPPALILLVVGTPILLERRRCAQLARFAAGAWNTLSS